MSGFTLYSVYWTINFKVKICLSLTWRRNQDKVRDSLSPTSQLGWGGGRHFWKFGWGFATEAFKPWPCFRQKLFISLPCSRPECIANIHSMFKVSGPERHPIVSPSSVFLSCHAILLPNDGSCVICAPWYSVTTNIPANGVDWYSTEGCTYYTRSQLDTRRHKTKNCIPCLWLKTLNTILCSVANTILGQIRESPRVLSKTKEWSD